MDHHHCGIDVGSKTCKLVLVGGRAQVEMAMDAPVSGDPDAVVHRLVTTARKAHGLKKKAMSVLLTGRNGAEIKSYPRCEPELKCLAAAAIALRPSTRTVIDSGAFTNKCISIDAQGKILDYAVNDICSSGSGIFLELVCKSLGIGLDELGELASNSGSTVPISSQCSIFAESEVIYLMNEGKPVQDIAAGVCGSIVGRLAPLASRLQVTPDVLFTGGVARNGAVRAMLSEALGVKVYSPPVDPMHALAFGAAVISAREGGS